MDNLILKRLEENIGKKRTEHSVGVMETAVKLANLYGGDENKAKIAGLLHDCAKYKDRSYLLKKADDFDIILDKMMSGNIQLIHGPLGAKVAKKDFGIEDEETLDAIRYHTTGRENMSLLEKIVYVADFTEPNRNFPGVDEARRLAYENLDKSLRCVMENSIVKLLQMNKVIHLDTIKARNYLVFEEEKSE